MKLLPIPLPPLGAPPPMGIWNSEILWRYPPAPSSPLHDLKNQMPPQLSTDPRLWNREDVAIFLRWCEREFDLPKFEMELFQMNGKALCLLTKNDLAERIPGAGDLLHNVIQMLVRESQSIHRHLPSSPVTPTSRYPLSPHSHPPTPNWSVLAPPDSPFHTAHLQHFIQNSVTLSPAPSVDSQTSSPPRGLEAVQTVFPKTETSSSSNQSDSEEDSYTDNQTSNSNNSHNSNNNINSQTAKALAHQQAILASQNSPPLTPITKDAPTNMNTNLNNLPHQISNVVNSWNTQQNNEKIQSPATPLTPSYMPVKNEFFPDTPEPNTNGRLLWDFLQQLLNDPQQRYSNHIAWKCRDTGVFKIVDPAGLAKLWGIQKNHLSMNYDKMSRALRYYYRVNILRKVQGERHCYQFLRNPSELKNIKNISLLRQTTPASSAPTTSSSSQSTNTQASQHQMQQMGHQPPPNSPMMALTNSIHHHHISSSISSPIPTMMQQTQHFNFPPQPNQFQQHQHHQQNSKMGSSAPSTPRDIKIEPKCDISDDMMPTDLSVSSSDRRYATNTNATSETYPLIRNSNGLTTITIVPQQNATTMEVTQNNNCIISNVNSSSSNIIDDDDIMLPTDLRKQEQ